MARRAQRLATCSASSSTPTIRWKRLRPRWRSCTSPTDSPCKRRRAKPDCRYRACASGCGGYGGGSRSWKESPMTTREPKTPTWLLERLAQGELDGEAAAAVRDRLTGEGRSLEDEVAALERADRET